MWQEFVISTGQWFFVISLIPTLRSKNKPPLFTSLTTGLILLVFGYTFATMHMWNSSISTFTVGMTWEVIAVQTILQGKKIVHLPSHKQ